MLKSLENDILITIQKKNLKHSHIINKNTYAIQIIYSSKNVFQTCIEELSRKQNQISGEIKFLQIFQ